MDSPRAILLMMGSDCCELIRGGKRANEILFSLSKSQERDQPLNKDYRQEMQLKRTKQI